MTQCIIDKEELFALPFSMDLTKAGKDQAYVSSPPHPSLVSLRAVILDWVYSNLGGGSAVAKFYNDGSLSEPISHRSLTWSITAGSSGYQQVKSSIIP